MKIKKFAFIYFILLVCLALVFSQAAAAPAVYQDGVKNTPDPQLKESEDSNSKPDKNKPGKPDKEAKQEAKQNKEKPGKQGKKTNFQGEVVSFDGGTLVLAVKDGTQVSVVVDDSTNVKSKTGAAPQPGDRAVVQTVQMEDGGYRAVRVNLLPGKPEKRHRVGLVTAYQAGVSITVQNKKGESTTFTITADTVLLPAERAGMLAEGAWVTVISPRFAVLDGSPVAKKIVIHPGVPGTGTDD